MSLYCDVCGKDIENPNGGDMVGLSARVNEEV